MPRTSPRASGSKTDRARLQRASLGGRPHSVKYLPIVDLEPLRRYPQFRRLWIGLAISQVGSQLTMVAVFFQVYLLTGSSLDVGLVSLAQLVPALVGSLLGGSVADAVDRRRLLVVTQIAMALCSVGLALNSRAAGALHAP